MRARDTSLELISQMQIRHERHESNRALRELKPSISKFRDFVFMRQVLVRDSDLTRNDRTRAWEPA